MAYLLTRIQTAYNGRALRGFLECQGFNTPADLTGMYLKGEPAEYILAACLVCTSTGE